MYQRCALAEENRERERERETAEGGRASCQGKEDGWGAGGWSWRRKRYGGIFPKIPVPNAIFASFLVFGVGFCGTSTQGTQKNFCPEKGLQNILKHNGRNTNSRPPYWKRTKA